MDQALAQIGNVSTRVNVPQFKTGQTVKVYQRIREGEKERIQMFEGLIIMVKNGNGVNGTITVRKVVDGIGVERVFPIHSPLIAKFEITKEAKIRRSKLYYMRDLSGKGARLKTTQLEGQVFEPTAQPEPTAEAPEEAAVEAPVDAAPAAEAPPEAPVAEAPAPEAAAPEAPAEETKEEAA